MAHLFVQPRELALSTLAVPVNGAQAYFYDAQTLNARASYTTPTLNIQHAVPVAASSGGVFPPIYLDPAGGPYKVDIKNPLTGTSLPGYPVDNVEALPDVLEAKSQDETDLAVNPTFLTYKTTPKVDPRRYTTSAWDDFSVQTTGLNSAIRKAIADKGSVLLPNGFYVKSGTQSFTMSGTGFTQGLVIEGPGRGAVIEQIDTSTSIFQFNGTTPTSDPTDAPLLLQGFVIAGITNSSGTGVKMNGVGNWTLRDMLIHSFATNVHLYSALLGLIDNCSIATAYGYGLLMQRNGAGTGCNRITIRDSKFTLCKTQGVYLASGDEVLFEGNQFEANGTSADLNTGGVRVVSTFGAEIGVGEVTFIGNRWEGSSGETFLIDINSAAKVNIDGGLMLNGADTTRVLNDLGCRSLTIRNVDTGASSVIVTAATKTTIDSVDVGTLTDTATYPIWHNVTTSAGYRPYGRPGSYTGTATGVTAQPANQTINYLLQGDQVELLLDAVFAATSNATTFTITGMPAGIRPSVQRSAVGVVTDNGAAKAARYVIGTDGTITVALLSTATYDSTAFTNSGSKGTAVCSIKYPR